MFCTKCGTKLDDGCKFCTTCGSPVRKRTNANSRSTPGTPSAPSTIPIQPTVNAESIVPKKKKSKKPLIIILIIVAVLALGCGAFMYITKGCPIFGHDMSAATCTEAATCTRCGYVSGSALGHVCGIGKCSRCGEFVNAETYNKICELEETIYGYIDSDEDNYYTVASENSKIKNCLSEISDLSSPYGELDTYTYYIKLCIELIPTTYNGDESDFANDNFYYKQYLNEAFQWFYEWSLDNID